MSERYPSGSAIPLPYHHLLLTDARRCEAFRTAIDRVVQPDDVVLDLGAGTGLLSYFAAQKARRVYAVELDSKIASLCTEFMEENGLSDRVEVVEESAFDYCPPEPVNAIVCEMLHVGMANEPQIAALNSTRARMELLFPNHPYVVIPHHTVSYLQLLNLKYDFYGYKARFPRYVDTYSTDGDLKQLSAIETFWTSEFKGIVDPNVNTTVDITATDNGTVNAVRLMTQVATAFDTEKPSLESLVDWYLMSLCLPLAEPMEMRTGQVASTHISYEAGCPVEEIEVNCDLSS